MDRPDIEKLLLNMDSSTKKELLESLLNHLINDLKEAEKEELLARFTDMNGHETRTIEMVEY